jgi:hypothetical protein
MSPTRAALVAAPLCVLASGIVRLIGTNDDQNWQLAHVLSVAALLLSIPAVLGLARPLGSVRSGIAVVIVTLTGLAASVVGVTIDIVAGLVSHDMAGLDRMLDRFDSLPGVHVACFVVGPQLFCGGLAVLLAMLAVAEVVPWWSPILVVGGVSLPLISVDFVPVGALCLLLGLSHVERSRI